MFNPGRLHECCLEQWRNFTKEAVSKGRGRLRIGGISGGVYFVEGFTGL